MRTTIIVCCLLAISSAFQLAPASISPIRYLQVNYDIHNNPITFRDLVQTNFDISIDQASTIIEEIKLALEVDNAKVHHMRWEFKLSNHVGVLKVIVLNASSINNGLVKLVGRAVTVTQPVPAVYEARQSCYRGSRRYGFCGPRPNICNTYHVERGLNGHEIELVNNALRAKLPEAQKLLSNA
jgi:hypothetical protein